MKPKSCVFEFSPYVPLRATGPFDSSGRDSAFRFAPASPRLFPAGISPLPSEDGAGAFPDAEIAAAATGFAGAAGGSAPGWPPPDSDEAGAPDALPDAPAAISRSICSLNLTTRS